MPKSTPARTVHAPSVSDQVRRIAAESFAREVDEASKVGNLGYMARVLVQATMPHSDPHTEIFDRSNGWLRLRIVALADGLPYGTVPRLLLAWLTTIAPCQAHHSGRAGTCCGARLP